MPSKRRPHQISFRNPHFFSKTSSSGSVLQHAGNFGKEGRGLAEAHQRGGKLQAVEYVDPNQGGELETRKPRTELENRVVRLFLSDLESRPRCYPLHHAPSLFASIFFLQISVIRKASRESLSGYAPKRSCFRQARLIHPQVQPPRVCFCKVKLFRDHGAERKLSNDIAHIKKTIDKLKQQIAQVENGAKDTSKRKRSGSSSKPSSHRPGKVPKHKRTWSCVISRFWWKTCSRR